MVIFICGEFDVENKEKQSMNSDTVQIELRNLTLDESEREILFVTEGRHLYFNTFVLSCKESVFAGYIIRARMRTGIMSCGN